MSFLTMPNPAAARRLFLGQSGLVLSGAAIALLAGNDALAAKTQGGAATDIQILNTALGAELDPGMSTFLHQHGVTSNDLTFFRERRATRQRWIGKLVSDA